jgi:hypothetical protein
MLQYSVYYDALLSALFFCDQRYTTEREKIHLQQSQSCCMVIFNQLLKIIISFFFLLKYIIKFCITKIGIIYIRFIPRSYCLMLS